MPPSRRQAAGSAHFSTAILCFSKSRSGPFRRGQKSDRLNPNLRPPMSRQTTLQAAQREESGSAVSRRLRRGGIVPAVVYGARQRSYPIQVNDKDFTDILRNQNSENFLVNLEIEGAEEKTKLAMVQEIQRNPMSGQVIHVDFQAVREDETLHATVPLELTGEATGVKLGGFLEVLIHSLDIECLPKDLPDTISHDVSEFEIGDSFCVNDLQLPDGVTTLVDGDAMVALVTEIKIALPEDEEEGEELEEGEVAEGEGEAAEGEGEAAES